MSDPWSPKGRIRRSNEVRSPLDSFRQRLRALGATADEVDEWTGTGSFADLDDEGRAEVERLRAAPDDEIRFEIEAVRGGYEDDEDLDLAGEGTSAVGVESDLGETSAATDDCDDETTPEEQDPAPETQEASIGTISASEDPEPSSTPQTATQAEGDAVDVPADLLDQNVPEILAWVDDDPTRAAVALELESLTNRPRKTLVEPLREIASGGSSS